MQDKLTRRHCKQQMTDWSISADVMNYLCAWVALPQPPDQGMLRSEQNICNAVYTHQQWQEQPTSNLLQPWCRLPSLIYHRHTPPGHQQL
jgi:hypothetical protein